MQDIFIQTLQDTLSFAPRILVIMFLSLFISALLIELGLIKRLEFMARPLLRLANLPEESAASFITSFGSPLAGNTMLARLYRQNLINKRQAFLSALLCGIPVYIKETFTYQIPVIIPILGVKIGGIYFLSFLAAGLARLLFIIYFGKRKLKKPGVDKDLVSSFSCQVDVQPVKRKFQDILLSSFKREVKVFLRIGIVFILMTFIVFLLINNGILSGLEGTVKPLTDFFKLPAASIVPVTTFLLSPLVGATSIATLVKDEQLSDFQAVVACMLGGLLMLPVFALRYSLAKYTAIFGFGLGVNIILVSTLLGMLVRGLFLLVFLFMI